MAYGLSFSEKFFFGTEWYPPKSSRPTNVLQAIESLEPDIKLEIAKHVFGYEGRAAEFFAKSETFDSEVLEKVRETDTCSNLDSPVTVWIDEEGNYTVDVYEEGE